MLSEPWIYDAAIIVTLRIYFVVILSPVPLHCQSCLAWQPSGARDKVNKFTIPICNNHESLDFQLNKQVRTITQKSSMMASGSLETLSLQDPLIVPQEETELYLAYTGNTIEVQKEEEARGLKVLIFH